MSPRVSTRLIVALAILAMVPAVSTDMYLPSLPAIAADLSASSTTVQLTLSLFIVGLAVGQLIWGALSDAFGRRIPLLCAIAIFAIVSILAACAPTIETLAVLRLIQGVAAAAGIAIGRAVARDLSDGWELARVLSLLAVIGGVAPIVAPIIGGLLAEFTQWRAALWAIAVFALGMAIVAVTTVPETLQPSDRLPLRAKPFLRTAASILTDPRFLRYALITVGTFGVLFTFIAASAFVFQRDYSLTPTAFAVAFAINAGAMIASGTLNATLVRRVNPRTLLRVWLGVLVAAAGVLVAAAVLWPSLPLIVVQLLIATISFSLPPLKANSMALALTDRPQGAGTASALLGTMQYLGGGLIAPISSSGGEVSLLSMSVTMLGCALFAAASYVLIGRSRAFLDK